MHRLTFSCLSSACSGQVWLACCCRKFTLCLSICCFLHKNVHSDTLHSLSTACLAIGLLLHSCVQHFGAYSDACRKFAKYCSSKLWHHILSNMPARALAFVHMLNCLYILVAPKCYGDGFRGKVSQAGQCSELAIVAMWTAKLLNLSRLPTAFWPTALLTMSALMHALAPRGCVAAVCQQMAETHCSVM